MFRYAAEVGLGSLCALAALLLIRNAASEALAAPAGVVGSPQQSPRDVPPARAVGPSFDSDASLPSSADEVASYKLRAKLDETRHVVEGSGTIQWRNASTAPVTELWFHLYLNAFKNERTLFLRSPFGAGRASARASDFGYIDVKRLVARELDGVDLWQTADRHTPGDPDDQTDIRVPLPKPIAPGQVLTLEVEFSAKLPTIVERTGYSGTYHFVAQWFPKLARLEPDGVWAHFAFHPQSEFYADFGRYDVTLDVPEKMRVGATGARTSERVERGRRVVTHSVGSVHDFAWTAWDGFAELRRKIAGVDVRLLFPEEQTHNASVTMNVLEFALPHFNARYGRYPYPVLTVVHPPEYARSSGGMEYPTLFTTGGHWLSARLGVREVETVTVHELGHQWFQGLVASDEHSWPFLDEGLNSYAEGVALEALYGAGSLLDWPDFEVSAEAVRRAVSAEYGKNEALAVPAARFASFQELGGLVYARTATLLATLERVHGSARIRTLLGRYARAYRFTHPSPKHLLAVATEVLGADGAATLQQALFDRSTVDYRIESVQSVPKSPPAGVFDRPEGRETVAQERPSHASWAGRVTVRRDGALRFPVAIDLLLEDGRRERRSWDGQEHRIVLDYAGSTPLVGAVVDPERRILLDDNLLNNAYGSGVMVPRTAERALYATQLLLGLIGP